MSWTVEFDDIAAKEYKKCSKELQKTISNYLYTKVLKSKHPKDLGKALRYDYLGLWRYRVGKYRIVCHLEEDKLVVLVLRIAKRDAVYKNL